MPEAGGGSVQLLEATPSSRGASTRGASARSASDSSSARSTLRAAAGPRGRSLSRAASPIGLLVLEGLLVREATVGDHPCAELLGPGDLLRAWDDRDAEVLLPRTRRVDRADQRAARDHRPGAGRAGRAVAGDLRRAVERAARRAERLVVMQAIAHLTRVDDRLLALLWCLAERWGRVVPGGVLVSLRLRTARSPAWSAPAGRRSPPRSAS